MYKQIFKIYENPIFYTVLYVWLVSLIGILIVLSKLSPQLTSLSFSVHDPSVIYYIFLFMFLATFGTAYVWGYLTFKIRVVEYMIAFDQEIEQERQRLLQAQKLSSLGKMAAGVAHEINNPLQIMSAQLSLLDKNKTTYSDPKLDKSVLLLQKQVDRIARIVRGLRSMTSDTSKEPSQKVSAYKVLNETLEYVEHRLQSRGIQFEYSFLNESENIQVFCRPTEFSQIIYNLLTNAIDAIEGTDSPWICMTVESDSPFLKLKVCDSGGPLTNEFVDEIMQPFVTTKAPNKGTGLGLSLALFMATSQGGDLFYDFEAPTTTFVLKIPLFKG